jgi:hypothetical protein
MRPRSNLSQEEIAQRMREQEERAKRRIAAQERAWAMKAKQYGTIKPKIILTPEQRQKLADDMERAYQGTPAQEIQIVDGPTIESPPDDEESSETD